MLSNYFNTADVEAVRQLISSAQHIVIITHMSPDGDAMGSSLGMRHYLRHIGKTEVTNIVPNSFPNFYDWMPDANQVFAYDSKQAEADIRLAQCDLLICTDFNEPKRIGALGEKIQFLSCPKILIDHHLHPSDFADVTLSYPGSPSASEIVFRLIYALETSVSSDKSIQSIFPVEAAECLYTGMMTDTGNFSFNSNHPEMYEIVAQLVSLGVDKDAIYNAVFNAYSADRMRLMGYCLYQKMRIFPDCHIALIYLSRKELYRFNFKSGDAEGIVNLPLQIRDIYYSVFMREDKIAPHEREKANGAKSKLKLSFRSQGDRPGNIFASEVFNGGGHANAAGGEYYGTLPDAVQQFLDNYHRYCKNA